jgi:hypothetical protein
MDSAVPYLVIDGVDYSSIIQSGIRRSFRARGQLYQMLDGSLASTRTSVGAEYVIAAIYTPEAAALYHGLAEAVNRAGAHDVTLMDGGGPVSFPAFLEPGGDIMGRLGKYETLTFTVLRRDRYA